MNRIRKALAGGVAAGLAVVAQALSSGGVGNVNWAVALGAAIAGGVAVWGIPNKAA